MTIELSVLTILALMAATMWMPFIYGVIKTNPEMPPDSRPLDPSKMTAWVHRAFRAHLNLLEQFLPFAVIVIVAHLAQVSNVVTVGASVVFLGLRIVHAIWMIGGYPVAPVRPLLFVAGWVCILAMGLTLLLS